MEDQSWRSKDKDKSNGESQSEPEGAKKFQPLWEVGGGDDSLALVPAF